MLKMALVVSIFPFISQCEGIKKGNNKEISSQQVSRRAKREREREKGIKEGESNPSGSKGWRDGPKIGRRGRGRGVDQNSHVSNQRMPYMVELGCVDGAEFMP